jgi:AbrB family looped-hinge helix DNA binding protein
MVPPAINLFISLKQRGKLPQPAVETMDIAYVTAKGQIVIPTRIRRKLGIKPGTKVCFVERGNDILFQPITKKYIRGMSGMLKARTSVARGFLEERKKERPKP